MADETKATEATEATTSSMTTETAIAQYQDAVKQVRHYTQLERQADYGGKHSRQRVAYARQNLRYYETRRDEALAALRATEAGVAWLAEQERKAEAATERMLAKYRAQTQQRMVDEYLYTSDLWLIRHSLWRLAEKFGRTQEAQEAKRLYDATMEMQRDLAQWISEHDAWRAVSRRDTQLRRAAERKAQKERETVTQAQTTDA